MTEAAFEVPVWYVLLGLLYMPYHLFGCLRGALQIELSFTGKLEFWFAVALTAIPMIVVWPCTVVFTAWPHVSNWHREKHPTDEPTRLP